MIKLIILSVFFVVLLLFFLLSGYGGLPVDLDWRRPERKTGRERTADSEQCAILKLVSLFLEFSDGQMDWRRHAHDNEKSQCKAARLAQYPAEEEDCQWEAATEVRLALFRRLLDSALFWSLHSSAATACNNRFLDRFDRSFSVKTD